MTDLELIAELARLLREVTQDAWDAPVRVAWHQEAGVALEAAERRANEGSFW